VKYFEDYNLSLTQRLGEIAILGQPPSLAEMMHLSWEKHCKPKSYLKIGNIMSDVKTD
jgi:hypothetical protein